MSRQAVVFVNDFQVGTLRQEPGRYVFEYTEAYLLTNQPAISLTLPKSQRLFVSPVLFPFFSGLLAEGTNLSLVSRAYRLDKRDEFGLLLATADKQTIGAVTVRELI